VKADAALVSAVRPAASHEPRAPGETLDMLVLHYTGMERAEAALDWLCTAASRVSCHYFVFEDGRIVQMVAEDKRAWHAGVSNWRGHSDINSRSIGIEIANPGHEFGYPPFPEPQMAAVVALCADIVTRRAIAARNVVAHGDVAPGRKRDPGEKFDWARLGAAGVGHWVAPEPVGEGPELHPGDSGAAVRSLQEQLVLYGYGLAVDGRFGDAMRAVVTAFQRHFRPARVDGAADRSTLMTLERLIAALPAEASRDWPPGTG
jgi:N-acetylmuramoyl-L-alanine amidase